MTALVKIDLHRHLEGSLRPSHLLAAATARFPTAPLDPDTLRRAVTVDESINDLVGYLARIDNAAALLTTPRDWVDAGAHAVEDAYDDGLRYLELRFSPWFISGRTGLHPRAVVDAVHEGVILASARTNLPVGLIATVVRDLGPESAMQQVDTILKTRDVWCAIDLAGDEAGVPCGDFAPAFARARDAGLHITVHAGEAAGPHSVADAVNHLGAERIGHGVRSVEDQALLEYLRDHKITLEVALTSNMQTHTSTAFGTHQIHKLLAAGVAVTLNTDNPTTSRTRLSEEHRRAIQEAHLPLSTLKVLAGYAARSSFTMKGRALSPD